MASPTLPSAFFDPQVTALPLSRRGLRVSANFPFNFPLQFLPVFLKIQLGDYSTPFRSRRAHQIGIRPQGYNRSAGFWRWEKGETPGFYEISCSVGRSIDPRISIDQAGEHLSNVSDCWDQTALDMQKCDDQEAAEISACNAAYNQRISGPCNIYCNSYTNCNRFSRFNPRRYTCKASRAVCVAAAAVARGACKAGALVVREACKAAAWAKSAACKAGVVGGNIVCSGSEVGGAIVDGLIGTGHVLLGAGATIGEIGSDSWCALKNVGKAIVDTGISIGHGLAGIFLGILTGGIFLGCVLVQWGFNRLCRFGNWIGKNFCLIGASFINGVCWLVWPLKAIIGGERNGQ